MKKSKKKSAKSAEKLKQQMLTERRKAEKAMRARQEMT